MDTDNRVVIVGARGWVEVDEGMERINSNGKNVIKIKFKMLKVNNFLQEYIKQMRKRSMY